MNLNFLFHIQCKLCKSYVTLKNGQKLEHCGRILNIKKEEYSCTIPLKQQLIKCLTENFFEIVEFLSDAEIERPVISDIYDSEVFKTRRNRVSTEKIILSLALNSDGISIFNGVKSSVWPIQIIFNFLPPRLRYLTRNVILVGVYYGENVDFRTFLQPLVDEINSLRDGFRFDFNEYILCCVPIITHVLADLPARAKIQGFYQYNGKQSCGYCLQKGEFVNGTQRYFLQETPSKARNHKETVDEMCKAKKGLGIKEKSVLSELADFDLIKCFGIDDLHAVYEGVFDKILNLFYKSESHMEFHLSADKQEAIDRRLLHMKPTNEISRKPRSLIKYLKILKANEKRSLLLFYLPLALSGIQKQKYVDNLCMLSSIVFMLSQKEILPTEVVDAEENVRVFIRNYERLYGRSNVTFNVHLLQHLPEVVRNLGPVWTQSCFVFETNNRYLVQGVMGTVNVVPQIIKKYILRKSQETNDEGVHLGVNKISLLGRAHRITLADELRKVVDMEALEVHYRLRINSAIYTSSYYKSTNSIDSFVEFVSGEIAEVKFYFADACQLYVCGTMFNVMNKKNQYMQIERSGTIFVKFVTQIKRKLIYLEVHDPFKKIQFVTYVPNHYELS